MAGGIDWFRWHHGSVSDGKFALVAHKAGASVAEVIAVWACLLEAASAAEDRGDPGTPDFEALDFSLGMSEGKARRIYERMRERSLLDGETGRIASWDKRQPKREDDTAADRKRRQREREHELQLATAVTLRESRNVTQSHAQVTQGHDRGEERRVDTQSDDCVSVASAPPTTRGKRLPADWSLPKSWGLWAQSEYPHWHPDTVRLIAATFADHWHAKAGKAGVMLDWEATWRNWCRSDITQRTHPPPRAHASKQTSLEARNAAVVAQALEKYAAN